MLSGVQWLRLSCKFQTFAKTPGRPKIRSGDELRRLKRNRPKDLWPLVESSARGGVKKTGLGAKTWDKVLSPDARATSRNSMLL